MILTISGKARAGKDTLAELIKSNFEKQGVSVLILHNADYLKFVAKEYFGWNGEKDLAGRTLLQELGTDIVRSKVPDIWVNTVSELAKGLSDEFDVFIVPDCRFPNEVNVLERKHSHVKAISITRTGDWDRELTPEQQNHSSETSMDNFNYDFRISADNIVELSREAEKLVSKLMRRETWEK